MAPEKEESGSPDCPDADMDTKRDRDRGRARDWPLFILIAFFPFIGGFIYSLQAPFYPIVAQSKGISVTMIGLVFAVYELMSLIMSPITATALTRIGPAAGLNLGTGLTGLSTIGLGLLTFVNDKIAFVALSMVLRILQSVGAAFRSISTLSMATYAFPKTVGLMVASIESISKVGSCLGVIAGGALMQVSGFGTTFIASGGLVLLIIFPSIIMLRGFTKQLENGVTNTNRLDLDQKTNGGPKRTIKQSEIGLWTLLREPLIALPIYLVVSAAGSHGFAMSVMEPNLQQFDLSPLQIGLMFTCPMLAYMVTSPLLGFLYDKLKGSPTALFRVQYVTPTLLLVAFTLIGPARFAPFGPTLPLVAIGLALIGIGYGSSSSSSFLIAVQNGKKLGTGSAADELRVHELISGIWRAAISLGLFVAPSLSGYLYDTIGFRNQCLLIVGLQIFNVALITVLGCGSRPQRVQDSSQSQS